MYDIIFFTYNIIYASKKAIIFKSSDKDHHQEPDMKDLANCCSPTFCIISGNVNCGKPQFSTLCRGTDKPPENFIGA